MRYLELLGNAVLTLVLIPALGLVLFLKTVVWVGEKLARAARIEE